MGLYVMSLGYFMLAAAYLVRDGVVAYVVLYWATGTFCAIIADIITRKAEGKETD